MPFSNPMLWGVLVLMLLPIIGTILWLLKRVLKLSFSVGKILLLLFAIWFVFTAVTGGLSDVFGNISKPKISQEDGKLTYISAFSKTDLDLADYQEQNQEYSVNTCLLYTSAIPMWSSRPWLSQATPSAPPKAISTFGQSIPSRCTAWRLPSARLGNTACWARTSLAAGSISIWRSVWAPALF